jgi:hypothetical protein
LTSASNIRDLRIIDVANFDYINFSFHLYKKRMSKSYINFYERIKDDHKQVDINENPLALQHPLPVGIIAGATGSGKSLCLLNIINNAGIFNNVWIFTGSNTDEPLYNFLKAKAPKGSVEIAEGVSSFPSKEIWIERGEKDGPQLIVIDDALFDKKFEKTMNAFCAYCRKANCSVILLSQSYHDSPLFLRKNANYVILMRGMNTRDLKTMLTNYASSNIDMHTLQKIYENATATNETGDFLMIDKKTKDKRLRFRKGFDQFYDLE